MGFKEMIMFLVLCNYLHGFSASSSSVSLQKTSLGDEASYDKSSNGPGMYMIHSRKNIAHGGGGGGGSGSSGGGTTNGGGSSGGTGQSGGNGESGSGTAAQGGTAVIPVYAAAGAANNNRHHSGSTSHNCLGLATLFGVALASLGLPLYLAFG